MEVEAGQKRLATESEKDGLLTITPLGAGREVGRSCHLLQYKGYNVLLDCGIHPGKTGGSALPYTSAVELADVDIVLVTHFHIDHCGAIPWLMQKTTFKGEVYMTHATKAIFRWMLSDFIRVSNSDFTAQLYDEKDLLKCLERIKAVNFREQTDFNGIKFTPYYAGHVLGACMFEIEIAGVKLLYTGDFSREEDRHLMSAEVPPHKPDILITECTFGVHEHEDKESRETRFTDSVHAIVQRGGRCLIPVFALGRAQELLLILDEYWSKHPELKNIPIYYASALAKRCMEVFRTYVNMMNDKINQRMSVRNPFDFQYISNLKSLGHFDEIGDHGPSVVLASPGMLQSGLSRELFERWAHGRNNGIIIAGYTVEGTLAREVMKEPKEVMSMAGKRIPLNCTVKYISFAAHVDYQQNRNFIRSLMPQHLILVHGQEHEMGRFKEAVTRDFEDSNDNITVYDPKNTQALTFHYQGEKRAKVVGKAAETKIEDGAKVSGVLVAKTFNYVIAEPADLPKFVDLNVTHIRQKQSVVFAYDLLLLKNLLKQIHGVGCVQSTPSERDTDILFMNLVTLRFEKDKRILHLEWMSSPEADMWADAVMSVALQIEASPRAMRLAAHQLVDKHENQVKTSLAQTLSKMMRDFFGTSNVFRESDDIMRVSMQSASATVTLPTFEISTTDTRLRNALAGIVKRLRILIDQDPHEEHKFQIEDGDTNGASEQHESADAGTKKSSDPDDLVVVDGDLPSPVGSAAPSPTASP